MKALGPIPELRRIDKRLIRFNHAYQRTLESARSQAAVKRIAEEFDWLKFGVLIVTKDDFEGMDGQHRHAGAMLRTDVADLPCLLLDIRPGPDRARIFVALNADRVALTPYALYKARLAAADPDAVALLAACTAAGVTLLTYPVPLEKLSPGSTVALGSLAAILKRSGGEYVTRVLNVIQRAYAERSGQLSAPMIKAVDDLLAEQIDEDIIAATLSRTDAAALSARCAAVRVETPEISTGEAMCRLIRSGDVPPPSAQSARAPKRKTRLHREAAAKAPKAKSKTFNFRRTAPAPEKTVPVEVRGNVPIRRFESGTFADIAIRTIEKAGKGRYEPYMKKTVQMYRCGDKVITTAQLIAMADQIRVKQGMQPLETVKGAA
jgi:hypothetical protein